MTEGAKRREKHIEWALLTVMRIYVVIDVPWCLLPLYHTGDRCRRHLPADDSARFWLPNASSPSRCSASP
ncbi:hypothetical protein V1J52_11625 [Streptomyces sp. TRM 70351]|uniref:hypothetical protein n=1 Tax=Streptomyces sp. TRM 70351 TaxID=3116552 RepID=UPI002E7B3891|nr:hypothetical protein [Streptomyces sp. TRM 70351]MEE1928823.1 hypothetical protein [Streptomyces sp. TRM 70351]